jgi:hypothetical protein
MVWDFIPDPDFFQPDPGVKKAPDSGSATLPVTMKYVVNRSFNISSSGSWD